MSGCCGENADTLAARQSTTLRAVLAINVMPFVVLVAAALYSSSPALLSNSLDNLGDALTYGFSLYAISLGTRAKAHTAQFKGGLILFAALVVLAQIGYRVWNPSEPIFQAMSGFALLSLAANTACLGLLWRHRQEDINMRSVWECSRNDIADGLAVLFAAAGVWAPVPPGRTSSLLHDLRCDSFDPRIESLPTRARAWLSKRNSYWTYAKAALG
jgi:Co/Zn/Cd efflux system component